MQNHNDNDYDEHAGIDAPQFIGVERVKDNHWRLTTDITKAVAAYDDFLSIEPERQEHVAILKAKASLEEKYPAPHPNTTLVVPWSSFTDSTSLYVLPLPTIQRHDIAKLIYETKLGDPSRDESEIVTELVAAAGGRVLVDFSPVNKSWYADSDLRQQKFDCVPMRYDTELVIDNNAAERRSKDYLRRRRRRQKELNAEQDARRFELLVVNFQFKACKVARDSLNDLLAKCIRTHKITVTDWNISLHSGEISKIFADHRRLVGVAAFRRLPLYTDLMSLWLCIVDTANKQPGGWSTIRETNTDLSPFNFLDGEIAAFKKIEARRLRDQRTNRDDVQRGQGGGDQTTVAVGGGGDLLGA